MVPDPDDPSRTRRFLAELFSRTWDNSRNRCFYAGNGQAGPSFGGSDEAFPDDSVIEGTYADYRVDGIFEDEFDFSQFDNDRCGSN